MQEIIVVCLLLFFGNSELIQNSILVYEMQFLNRFQILVHIISYLCILKNFRMQQILLCLKCICVWVWWLTHHIALIFGCNGYTWSHFNIHHWPACHSTEILSTRFVVDLAWDNIYNIYCMAESCANKSLLALPSRPTMAALHFFTLVILLFSATKFK